MGYYRSLLVALLSAGALASLGPRRRRDRPMDVLASVVDRARREDEAPTSQPKTSQPGTSQPGTSQPGTRVFDDLALRPPPEPPAAAYTGPVADAPRPAPAPGGPSRLTRNLLVATTAAIVAVSLVIVGVTLSGGSPTSVASGGSTSGSSSAGGSGSRAAGSGPNPAPSGSVRSAGSGTQSGSGGAGPGFSGGPPHITALKPAHGVAGQQLTVYGSGFFSSDGYISVYFGGAQASTSCPDTSTCTVTVPAPPAGGGTVKVTLITATGTSNAVPFTYS